MFSFFRHSPNLKGTQEISFRTLSHAAIQGEEWWGLLAEVEALSKVIDEGVIGIAHERNEQEQLVALFLHRDFLSETPDSLIMSPDTLLVKKAAELKWTRSSSQTDLVISKKLMRHPSPCTWELHVSDTLRRGQIFTQERHLVAAPFRLFI